MGMDNRMRGLFGLIDDVKYVYKIQAEAEITAEEYQYCQVVSGYLFDENIGITHTLGPTWELIHDPRFRAIEYCFIFQRKALFGGDARYGKQFITEEGVFSSATADLEQYAEILENGRHFAEVVQREHYNPRDFWTQPDITIWQFVKQECPNYFDKQNIPNKLAQTIVACIHRDLLGLILDYAEVANVQEWVSIETGQIVDDVKKAEITEHNPVVWQEVDLLEKALTFRTLLRVTAARILDKLEITKMFDMKDWSLTEFERDKVLELVYNRGYSWPEDRTKILVNVVSYLAGLKDMDMMQRELVQLREAKERSSLVVSALKDGTRAPITRYTEPEVEIGLDPHAQLVIEIMNNPLKKDLFLMYQAAEEDQDLEVITILAPIFAGPGYVVTEEIFRDIVRQIALVQERLEIQQKEGRLDIYGQRPNPETGTAQVKMPDGTWRDTAFPDQLTSADTKIIEKVFNRPDPNEQVKAPEGAIVTETGFPDKWITGPYPCTQCQHPNYDGMCECGGKPNKFNREKN
jgi:hypothetical protein